MTAMQIPWSEGSWTNPPVHVEPVGDTLRVTAQEGSDAWRHTSYGFVHDTEHALLRPLAIGRAVEVDFRCELSGQFDQAGAFLRFDDEHWIKSGVEHSDGVDMLGGVVTMGRSDWSTGPVPDWAGRVVTIRISRAEESVTVRARVDSGRFHLVRLAPTPPGGHATAGPFLCAPTRSGLSIDFLGWRETEADGSLHE
jgi:regulation of enolase protein 1 (concanavalin A-like superfamily)